MDTEGRGDRKGSEGKGETEEERKMIKNRRIESR